MIVSVSGISYHCLIIGACGMTGLIKMKKVDEVFMMRSGPHLPRKKNGAVTECAGRSCVGFQRGVTLCWFPKGSMYYVGAKGERFAD